MLLIAIHITIHIAINYYCRIIRNMICYDMTTITINYYCCIIRNMICYDMTTITINYYCCIIRNMICYDMTTITINYYCCITRNMICYDMTTITIILAIFYPFSQFCEIDVSLPSLNKKNKTAPNLFQRGVEYGEYDSNSSHII